ncbi:MAG TPA: exodeoxyribonuclease V subunit gamma, partial [Kofleriaceae bacterium]|nr:exodeoxyribonuclease V subunit gamma [Kofleriaceae bacterium]
MGGRGVIHVCYSNRLEELAAALADDLALARRGGGGPGACDPLAPLTVVVPNQMVAAYTRREVARRLGIAANLRFPHLDRFLADLCHAGRPWRVLDRRLLQVLILALFEDGELHPELGQVRDYIGARDGAGELRRVQLAGELADVLLDYAMSRPEMMTAWAGLEGERR